MEYGIVKCSKWHRGWHSRGLFSWKKSFLAKKQRVKVLVTMSWGFAERTKNESFTCKMVRTWHFTTWLKVRIHKSIEVFIIFIYLRTFFFTHCSVEEYTKSRRDKMVVDHNPDEIYSKRKKEKYQSHKRGSFVVAKHEVSNWWLGEVFREYAFLYWCRYESACFKFWDKSIKHGLSLDPNQFKKGKKHF